MPFNFSEERSPERCINFIFAADSSVDPAVTGRQQSVSPEIQIQPPRLLVVRESTKRSYRASKAPQGNQTTVLQACSIGKLQQAVGHIHDPAAAPSTTCSSSRLTVLPSPVQWQVSALAEGLSGARKPPRIKLLSPLRGQSQQTWALGTVSPPGSTAPSPKRPVCAPPTQPGRNDTTVCHTTCRLFRILEYSARGADRSPVERERERERETVLKCCK